MKKFKTSLLLVALCGIGLAFVNKPPQPSPPDIHAYSFLFKSTDGSRMYYGQDLTSIGYEKGFDYTCMAADYICTFLADPTRSHTDLTGNYFVTWDVPVSGIDDSGNYESF